jgi:hypothetical protein
MKQLLLAFSVFFLVKWGEFAAFKTEGAARAAGVVVKPYSTRHVGDGVLVRVNRERRFDTLREAEQYRSYLLESAFGRPWIMTSPAVTISRVEEQVVTP